MEKNPKKLDPRIEDIIYDEEHFIEDYMIFDEDDLCLPYESAMEP